MSTVLTRWSPSELGARVDDVLAVYAAAMQVSLPLARTRRGILHGHLDRPGLRASAVEDRGALVGIAYGYRGSPGQWWHDQVSNALPEHLAERWLHSSFEVCELHVLPEYQGRGVGRALLDDLLDGPGTATAVLTTPDHETRARGFYRAGGWVDLLTGLRFPGDPRLFAVLGKDLPTRPS